MSNLVLFGCGAHTLKFLELLLCINRKADYIADNDPGKIGKLYAEIPIIDPQKLLTMDCVIVISCTFWKEITQQLMEMGIADKIKSIKEILEPYGREEVIPFKDEPHFRKSRTIFVDLFSGSPWGGAENWNMNIARVLKQGGERVRLLANDVVETDRLKSKDAGISMKQFAGNARVSDIIEYLSDHLPFVFINSFTGTPFFAALALKAIHPGLVKIIDVLHIDKQDVYNLHLQFSEMVDSFIGVSTKITKNLVETYGIEADRVYFKEQPIETDKYFQRKYTMAVDRPLKLGYGARLVKEQKRVDLLPELITELEKYEVNYELEIAGEGECEEMLQNFISEHGLESKIRLLGQLDQKEMKDFWKRQDIFLNISEYEGASLAMLEAMGSGCVPVVTDVSGVEDFVKNGKSGFICGIGETSSMTQAVLLLCKRRDLIKLYGQNARKEVMDRCSAEQYAEFLLSLC